MESEWARSFGQPDEAIEDPLVVEEIVHLAGSTVGRFTIEPGWRWSEHVRPRVGTNWCEARHVGVCVGGRLGVQLETGGAYTIDAGQVFVIPSGHDIWVDGPDPAETIEWAGALSWHPGPVGSGSRALATLLLSDIVDSTPTAARLGEVQWLNLLRTHDDITADVVNRFHGRLVKHTGDGALAVFPSAGNAVLAGRALVAAIRPIGIEVRVGIHTGEIDVSNEDVHGLPVHQLARIAGMAAGSEVLVSHTTALLADNSVGELEPRGRHELRGLTGEVELYSATGAPA